MEEEPARTHTFLILVVLVAVATGALHLLALQFYLYWTLWWFDIVLHFLGGVWVGLTAFWFLYLARLIPVLPTTQSSMVLSLVLVTLAVGVGWEIFEYINGLFGTSDYVLDTVIDLVMDTTGALAVALFVLKSSFRVVLQ